MYTHPVPVSGSPSMADDLLIGATAIAIFLYDDPKRRRSIYHLHATSRIPTFKIGSRICARRSVLRAWMAEQENRSREGKK
jgi:hypothetical protein